MLINSSVRLLEYLAEVEFKRDQNVAWVIHMVTELP